MLDTTNCQDHFDEVVRTAKGTGQWDKLEPMLEALGEYKYESKATTCKLFQYLSIPLSFITHIYVGNDLVASGALVWERNDEGQRAWEFHTS